MSFIFLVGFAGALSGLSVLSFCLFERGDLRTLSVVLDCVVEESSVSLVLDETDDDFLGPFGCTFLCVVLAMAQLCR